MVVKAVLPSVAGDNGVRQPGQIHLLPSGSSQRWVVGFATPCLRIAGGRQANTCCAPFVPEPPACSCRPTQLSGEGLARRFQPPDWRCRAWGERSLGINLSIPVSVQFRLPITDLRPGLRCRRRCAQHPRPGGRRDIRPARHARGARCSRCRGIAMTQPPARYAVRRNASGAGQGAAGKPDDCQDFAHPEADRRRKVTFPLGRLRLVRTARREAASPWKPTTSPQAWVWTDQPPDLQTANASASAKVKLPAP